MTSNIQLTAGQAATFASQIYNSYSARVSTNTLTVPVTPEPPVAGFVLLDSKYDSITNYYGEAWKNPQTNEIVVVSRGTVPDKRDAAADLNIAAGHEPPSAKIALLGADPKAPAWTVDKPFGEIAAVAVGKNALLVAGVNRDKQGKVTASGMCAVQLSDGKILWRESLSAPPVAWGLALDRGGQIVVTTTDGRMIAFAQK